MTSHSIRFVSFCQDVREGRVEALAACLQEGGVFKKGVADKLLVEAAQHGQMSALNLLLPYADPRSAHASALKEAARDGHKNVVSHLLEVAEYDPEAIKGALFMANLRFHDSVVACLVPKVKVDDLVMQYRYFAMDPDRCAAADRLAPYLPLNIMEETLKENPRHEFPISRSYVDAGRLAENLSSILVSPPVDPAEKSRRPRI